MNNGYGISDYAAVLEEKEEEGEKKEENEEEKEKEEGKIYALIKNRLKGRLSCTYEKS